jgi:iron complex outermembrane receptor protein
VDSRYTVGNPGNIFSVSGANLPGVGAPYAAVPQGFTGPPTQAAYAATAGQLNKLSLFSDIGLIPESDRAGLLASGSYDLTSSSQLFARFLYSHVKQDQDAGPAGFLFGSPAFQAYTVSAANPFNPFGETVGIGYVFPGTTLNTYSTDFLMPTLGVRGQFGASWQWEVAAWGSSEREKVTISGQPKSNLQAALNSSDPNSALNPFIDGAPGSTQLVNSVLYTDVQNYRGNSFSASALLRGSPIRLPSGALQLALGAEFTHTTLHAEDDSGNGSPINLTSPTVGRKNYAVYGEAKIPVLGPSAKGAEDLLDVTVAGRFDHFDDFGGKWTAEAGGALHPLPGLSLRAHWGQSFKAPSLLQLFETQNTFVRPIVDPLTGATTPVTVTTGGNPHLQPISGQSHSFDLVYMDAAVAGLEVSLTNWSIHENNSIQVLNTQVIVNHETEFPGAVVRAPSCASGPPCPIVSVNSTFTNFGAIDVAGIDYLLSYRFSLAGIEWQPSISATQTYRYTVAFQPGESATDRVSQANDDTNWAPRWKGTVAVQILKEEWSGRVAARFIGSYRDYDPLLNGTYLTLGNVWYVDVNLRYGLERLSGAPRWLQGLGLEIGAVNLFNRQPQFSNQVSGFYGFDYLQADMRGRFIYGQLAGRW